MSYSLNVANARPMLRLSATIILTGVVGYGVRSLVH
jgi:hypothetical protein